MDGRIFFKRWSLFWSKNLSRRKKSTPYPSLYFNGLSLRESSLLLAAARSVAECSHQSFLHASRTAAQTKSPCTLCYFGVLSISECIVLCCSYRSPGGLAVFVSRLCQCGLEIMSMSALPAVYRGRNFIRT